MGDQNQRVFRAKIAGRELLVEDHLKAPQSQCDESNADVINAQALEEQQGPLTLQVARVLDQ